MHVELLTREEALFDMENLAVNAALICHGNYHSPLTHLLEKINNKEFLTRIIGYEHFSILEHITLSYGIVQISRAVLQELARHRHITIHVESTRHTLRKNLNDETWYSVLYGSLDDDKKKLLREFKAFADKHPLMPNDELKYYAPEFLPTNLIMTVNVRELRHILDLRTDKRALKEFRELARKLFEAIPEEYKYLLEDCVHDA